MSNALHKKLHKLCKRAENKKTEMLSNSNKSIDNKLYDILNGGLPGAVIRLVCGKL